MRFDGVVHAGACRYFIGTQVQFCGEYHILAHGAKSLTDEFFVVSRIEHHVTVNLGRIKEVATCFKSLAHRVDAVVGFRHLAVAVRKTHAAHANGGDFEIAQFPFLHLCLPCSVLLCGLNEPAKECDC